MIQVIFLILLTVTANWYFGWRIFCTLPTGGNPVGLILGIFLILAELLITLKMMVQFYNCVGNRKFRLEIPEYQDSDLPDVDVFVTTCREPVELLEYTLKACTGLKYPDPAKLHIWLLDDADSPEMEALAKRLQVGYITRENHSGAKAGNLNHALTVTKAPLFVIFDADMAPRPDFLLKTIPYFLKGSH